MKIFVWILSFFVLLFLVVLAALPTWVSTPSGTQTVVDWINQRHEGKLTLEKLHLSWFGSQHIENLTLFDQSGNLIFNVKQLDTNTSLWYLALGGRSFGETNIEEPYLYLTEEASEEKKEKVKKRNKRINSLFSRKKLPAFDALDVRDGTVIFDSKKFVQIIFSQVQIEKAKKNDRLQISAKTVQGHQEGSIIIDGSFGKKLEGSAKLIHFPLAALDEWKGSTLFTDAFGPTLSLEIHFARDGQSNLFIDGTANSANLSAYIEGTTEDGTFKLNPKTRLNFLLTPALFKALIDEKERKEWDLASKTEMKIQVERGVFPLSLKEERFKEIVLQANLKIDRAELHHQQLGSYSLNNFFGSVTTQKNIEIAYSGEIVGKEKTKLSGNISMTPENHILFRYSYQGFPVSLLSLVSSDLEKNVRILFGGIFDMESQGSYIDGKLDTDMNVTSPQNRLSMQIQGDFSDLSFNGEGSYKVPFAKTKILGDVLDYRLNGNLKLTDEHFYIPFVTGKVSSPTLSFDVRGKLGTEDLPMGPDSFYGVATGFVKQAATTLENMVVFAQIDGPNHVASFKAEGKGIDVVIDVDQFIKDGEIALDQSRVNFSAQLGDFPVSFIEPFIAEEVNLSPFIGETIQLTAEGSYTPKEEQHFTIDMQAQGDGFSASLAFSLDGTLTVKQDHPSYITWEITPQRYKTIMQAFRLDKTIEPTFFLTSPTTLSLNIQQLTCPSIFPESLGQFLCQSGFVGDVHLGRTVFNSKYAKESITFQDVKGFVRGANFSEGIDLILNGEILAANVPGSKKSSFAFDGQMLNFWTKTGHFNRAGLTLKGALSLDLLPVRQVTGLLPVDEQMRILVQAVLGELVNARIYGEISQMSGPLTVDIKASNFKAMLPLQLHPHAIYLRDFVNAEITLTEAVNATLLKDLNPLFISGAYSDHPLRLTIDPQGFALPIRPFALQGLRIDRAALDIGRIWVRNGGQVQYLVNFLKAQEITHDGTMSAWFTPIYFSLRNGVTSYQRFDALLAGNIHIAMWGGINLLNNQVSMTLGIAPSTLSQRFKISGLQKQNMFQVQMRGTTDKLDLDWSAASTRIAFLVAKSAGGGLGKLIGGLLEPLFTSNLGEEPVPPPTTIPFPWEY